MVTQAPLVWRVTELAMEKTPHFGQSSEKRGAFHLFLELISPFSECL